MRNKKGVVLPLLMSLLVSGSSAIENSGKGNNSKGGSNVTLDNRKNIETGKTIASYTIPAILAFILGYKFGYRKENVKEKETQEGKALNKCQFFSCPRGGKEFELGDNVYICPSCFVIRCYSCCREPCDCNSNKMVKIEDFVKKLEYIPAYRNVAKLAKYRFLMKAREEQKKKEEELAKNAKNLNEILEL